MWIALFALGAISGSFAGVVAARYDPGRFLFARETIGGRSRCPSCGATLRWFELIPIVSFLLQRGRCRSCGNRIGIAHLLIELLSGALFVAVPYAVMYGGAYLQGPSWHATLTATIWLIAFYSLLVLAYIDIRLRIIPDEISIIVMAAGAALAFVERTVLIAPRGSFLGPYGALLGAVDQIAVNRAVGFLAGALFFGAVVLATRGRGMGMGDLKTAAALGALFGWPDIVVLAAFAFVLGSLAGIAAMLGGGYTMKSAIPFGPFLVLGAYLLFFFGEPLARAYLSLAGF